MPDWTPALLQRARTLSAENLPKIADNAWKLCNLAASKKVPGEFVQEWQAALIKNGFALARNLCLEATE